MNSTSFEERIALIYMKRANDALEILVGRNYDGIKPSLRLRAYIAKKNQLKEMESAYPEYGTTLLNLRNNHNYHAHAAIHQLLDTALETLDDKFAQVVDNHLHEHTDLYPLAA